MCWLWPILGTAIGAILGYLLGRSSSQTLNQRLTEENAQLTSKLSKLAGDVNHLSHYRDQLSRVKAVVSEYADDIPKS